MIIPFKPLEIRHTQSGWVLDAYLVEKAILPVSIIFDPKELYVASFCCNSKRSKIKSLFEKTINELYKETVQ